MTRIFTRLRQMVWRSDPNEADNLIAATEAFVAAGDQGLLAWVRAGGQQQEFRRRAALTVMATEAEYPHLMAPLR